MTVTVPRVNEVRTYLCLAKAKIWLIIYRLIEIIFRSHVRTAAPKLPMSHLLAADTSLLLLSCEEQHP
jgi:hypothetical protein